jgi:hypothetical protein
MDSHDRRSRVTTQNERDVVFFKGNEKSELQRGEGLKEEHNQLFKLVFCASRQRSCQQSE